MVLPHQRPVSGTKVNLGKLAANDKEQVIMNQTI